MKHSGLILSILTAAMVSVVFWLAIGVLRSNTEILTSAINGSSREGGFSLVSIAHLLSTLASVAVATAKITIITLSLWFLSLQTIRRTKLFNRLSIIVDGS